MKDKKVLISKRALEGMLFELMNSSADKPVSFFLNPKNWMTLDEFAKTYRDVDENLIKKIQKYTENYNG